MLDLCAAMGSVLFAWLVLAILFVGAGLLFLRVMGLRLIDADRVMLAFWSGAGLTVALLQVWHLWRPVGWSALATLIVPAALGYAWSARGLWAWLRGRHDLRAAALAALAVLWCANRAIGPGDFFDSGLYHYSVVKWNESHAIVPGLANLNLRFGFNNASHLLVAALDQGPWEGRAHHLGNGLFLAALAAGVALMTARVWRGRGGASALAMAALAPPLVMVALSKEASSPTTDFPAAVALWLATWRLAVLATDDRPHQDRGADVAFVALAAAVAVCFKLSAVVPALAISGAALGMWILLHRPGPRRSLLAIGAAALLWLALCGPWIARSAVLSGYPLYPSTALPLDVEWRVPQWRVEVQQDAIDSWARLKYSIFVGDRLSRSRFAGLAKHLALPEEPLRAMRWVRPWLLAQTIAAPAAVVFPIALCGVTWLWWLWRRVRRTAHALEWRALALFPGFLGVVAWFALAPEPRFGYGVAWGLLSISTALVAWSARPGPAVRRATALACVALAVPVMVHQSAARRVAGRDAPASRVPFLGPGADGGFHPNPAPDVVAVATRSGLLLNIPGGEGNQCWAAPLPATDQLDRDLCLRREGDLSSGFLFRVPARIRESGASSPP